MYWKKTKKSHPGGCFLNEKTKVKNLLLKLRLSIHVTRLCLGNSDSDEHLKGDTDDVTIIFSIYQTKNNIEREYHCK